MKRVILGLFVVVNLHAIGYEELLQPAIQNNTTLQIDKTKKQSIALQGQIEVLAKKSLLISKKIVEILKASCYTPFPHNSNYNANMYREHWKK